jgi:signal transduction histidine kinase
LELLAESPVFIEGNPQLINILLTNLISNAIKFTPESGSVIVHVANVTNGVSLSVEDTGPGIPEEKKAWVFERLNKGSKGGGSGLGLSIVKEISHLHQASITLKDKMDDSGLIVTLLLPALSEA